MTDQEFNLIKGITLILATVVGIISLIVTYFQYRRNTKLKRIDLYNDYRDKMVDEENLKNILDLLEEDSEDIKDVPRMNRFKFIGYYEDIALLLNSKFIKPEIAHYMFAYYALRCWESEYFWHDIERNSHYWRVFKEFVEKMQKLEKDNMTIAANKELKFKL